MKKFTLAVLTMVIALSAGCAPKPQAATADQAIEQSKSMGAPQEQAKYLVSQANAFVNSQKFDDAIASAKYVLANLDANSVEAKNIIEKATAEIKAMAEQKAQELKNKLNNIGN